MLASGSCIPFSLCFLILCPLPMAVQLWAMLKAILPDNIILRISDTSEGINVSWTRPDATINRHCFESELRYRSTCDTDWRNVKVRDLFYALKPDRKKRYEFQIRMRYDTICGNQNKWSMWTRKMSWENAAQKESCPVEGHSPHYIRLYLGTILPLCLGVILTLVLLQKRIRGFFLPSIPGPKHIPEKLPSIEQFQCQYVYIETSQACETVDIEIVSVGGSRKGDEDDRENEKVNTENENHGVDLFDTGLHGFPSLVDNGAYLKFFEQAVEER